MAQVFVDFVTFKASWRKRLRWSELIKSVSHKRWDAFNGDATANHVEIISAGNAEIETTTT
ncbi:hypothetical protein LTR74_016981 [Friedmanniomyces endolithicus]|nr:hypothetical protein LTR74_016981 [Friedmanniomyces endolithicus]